MPTPPRRRVCFVTGTRAEFGLMSATLHALRRARSIDLQIVATGMHLDPGRGKTLDQIRRDGWHVDAVVNWPAAAAAADPGATAAATGKAMAGLADAFERLQADVVLVVGDRVEAFAAAAAAHVSNRVVAHVHGGDRALGLVDDSLRHAITKLAHLHFPATARSAARIRKLGEDPWRIHQVGSPGLDGIRRSAAPAAQVRRAFGIAPRRFALLVLHPADPDDAAEERRARLVLDATVASDVGPIVIVCPNNDPGSAGIMAVWRAVDRAGIDSITVRHDVPRPSFLGLMRDAAVLVGNSSSGIIEAASFGTPVVDVGHRQAGRERGTNVTNVPYDVARIRRAIRRAAATRFPTENIYGSGHARRGIADILGRVPLDATLRRKLIAY